MIEKVFLGEVGNLPFMIGHRAEPRNPPGIPDRLPFRLELNRQTGVLGQQFDPKVERCLNRCYAEGSLLGTAMDDNDLGRPYALDFFDFVAGQIRSMSSKCGLEIGAGRGYLMKLLADHGADMLGIEPGVQNRDHWRRQRLRVVEGHFPHPDANGPFDFVIAYAVLEHISDPLHFVRCVVSRLRPGGIFAISVPDCAPSIIRHDPSILVHEHYSYFTERSLRHLISRAGLEVIELRPAGYGGAIYCSAKPMIEEPVTPRFEVPMREDNLDLYRTYAHECIAQPARIRRALETAASANKKVGIYCPARALNVLPTDANVRFFDDDPELNGRYYPPFPIAIEGRGALFNKPVDELWIMTRTFGLRLAEELRKCDRLNATSIVQLDEISEASRGDKV